MTSEVVASSGNKQHRVHGSDIENILKHTYYGVDFSRIHRLRMRSLRWLSKSPRLTMYRLRRPVHLVLDFDSTLTVRDTIALLREVPIQRNARVGKELYPVPEWSAMEQAYMKDYDHHQKTEADRQSASESSRSLDPFVGQAKDYSQMLARRRVVEEQSSRRLEEWNFFTAVTRADVREAADTVVRDGRLEMREHWSDLLQAFVPKDGSDEVAKESKVSIISVSWSATFIRQCLLAVLRIENQDRTALTRYLEEQLTIHSNEIAGLDDSEGSNGKMQGDVHSSADKLACLAPNYDHERSFPLLGDRERDARKAHLIYIGDSSTDFNCLIAADIGVWLCPASDREQAQEQCERTFKPLKLTVRTIDDADHSPLQVDNIVWAQNFQQIAHYLSHGTARWNHLCMQDPPSDS